jgi:hypothetical protein
MWWIAIVDKRDGWLLEKYKWSAMGKSREKPFYAHSPTYAWENDASPRLHQAVTGHKWEMIDHINRNGHDNRKCNLRETDNSKNQRGKIKQYGFAESVGTSSVYKGVSKHHGQWRARINVDGQLKELGRFDTEVEAAVCYNHHAPASLRRFSKAQCNPNQGD